MVSLRKEPGYDDHTVSKIVNLKRRHYSVEFISKKVDVSVEEVERICWKHASKHMNKERLVEEKNWALRRSQQTTYQNKRLIGKKKWEDARIERNVQHILKVRKDFSDSVLVQEVDYDFLKNQFAAFKYMEYAKGIDQDTMNLLLFFHTESPFLKKYFLEYTKNYGVEFISFDKFYKEGWLNVWTTTKVAKLKLYKLSNKGTQMVDLFYGLVLGTKKFPERKAEESKIKESFRDIMRSLNKRG